MSEAKYGCFTCKWMDEEMRECHRRGPAVVVDKTQFDTVNLDAVWPAVDESGWCGEWEGR